MPEKQYFLKGRNKYKNRMSEEEHFEKTNICNIRS